MPRGWAWSTLGEIGQYLNGRAFKKSEWSPTGRVIIRIQDLTGSGGSPNHFAGAVEPRYEVHRGDLLISWAATLGAYLWDADDAVLNQHIFKVSSFINPRFHFYLAQSVIADLYRQAHGSGMVHVTKGTFEAVRVALPPLREQARVVAAIEERVSDLDASVAALESVRAQLPRYRAAVLRAACEGRLVARGPQDWTQVTLGEVATDVSYGTSAKTTAELGVPVLRMGNIVDGRLSFNTLKYLPSSHHEFPWLLLAPGDILFNRTNSAELVGKTAVYGGLPTPCSFASYLIRIRVSDRCEPRYLSAYLNSLLGRTWIASVVSQQVGQANVSGGKLKSMPIRLPPLAEQRRIVDEIERRLSLAGALRQAVEAAIMRAARLRQAILRSAFQGGLVPQDPSDEPAAALLARVRPGAARPRGSGHHAGGVAS